MRGSNASIYSTAFGNEKNVDVNDKNPFRYSGEYFDKETGLIYLRARYYDPKIGRFISEDSYWGKDIDPLSLNLYTYCENQPVTYVDSDGNRPIYSDNETAPMKVASLNATKGMVKRINSKTVSSSNKVKTTSKVIKPGEYGNGIGGKIIDVWVSAPPYKVLNAVSNWQDNNPEIMTVIEVAAVVVSVGYVGKGMVTSGRTSSAVNKQPATVDDLIEMMNKRNGVNARFAMGDEEAYLKAVYAEASHMMMENGTSDIIFRKDVSSRWSAYHEWLHRYLQTKNGGITPGEDTIIENFLERHKGLFKIGN